MYILAGQEFTVLQLRAVGGARGRDSLLRTCQGFGREQPGWPAAWPRQDGSHPGAGHDMT